MINSLTIHKAAAAQQEEDPIKLLSKKEGVKGFLVFNHDGSNDWNNNNNLKGIIIKRDESVISYEKAV